MEVIYVDRNPYLEILADVGDTVIRLDAGECQLLAAFLREALDKIESNDDLAWYLRNIAGYRPRLELATNVWKALSHDSRDVSATRQLFCQIPDSIRSESG